MTEAHGSADPAQVAFTSRPSAADVIANAAAYMRRTGIALLFGTFATVSSILGLVLAGDATSLIFLLLGLSFLSGVFAVPFVWWSVRRRRDLVLAPLDVVADEEGIGVTASYGSSRHAWSVYRRVRETDRAFLLDMGTGSAAMITKRGVPDTDVAAFRALLVRVGVLATPGGLRRYLRPLVWVAVGAGLALALWFGPRALSTIGATATMTIATEVGDGTVTVTGETDLPDGAVIGIQAVQWDQWQREAADGTAPDVETSPWVRPGQAVVADGRYEATLPIDGWPAGHGVAFAYFWVDAGQPADVIARFGADGSGLKGPDVTDRDLFGPTLQVQDDFDIP